MALKTIIGTIALVAVVALLGCDEAGVPVFDSLFATPDSVPRGGVACLKCAASDPDWGEVTIEWQAKEGMVQPDTGDSVTYLAPSLDVLDTVFVTITDDQGEEADSFVTVFVAEGLCGGRPEVLTGTYSELVYADRDTVYFVDEALDGYEIRWVLSDGFDFDTLLRWDHDILDLDGSEEHLYFLDRDVSGGEPRYRVQRVDKEGGNLATVVDFGGRDSAILDIAVSATDLLVCWYETVLDTIASGRLTAFPLGSGSSRELVTVTAPRNDETTVSRPVGVGDAVFCLLASNDPDVGAVLKASRSTGEVDTLHASPYTGSLSRWDWLAHDDEVVYWSQRELGAIGAVLESGSAPGYIVPAGGDAAGVTHLVAAQGFGNSGTRLFWTVSGDLRGLVVPTMDVLYDMDRGTGSFAALTRNEDFLFYVRDNGVASELVRQLMP